MSRITASATTATTLVLGMGATGQSVARWLARAGATAAFADERADVDDAVIRDILPDAECMSGFDTVDVNRFDQIVASPGIPDSAPILQRAFLARVPVISDVELFLRDARARVIGVTGTNGKSTVVTLLAAMCEHAGVTHAAGGNLGPPALDLPVLAADDVYVLELSSYQLQRTHNLVLHASTVLNIAPDHLDWHRDFAEYRAAKARILANTAYAIVNADAPYVDLVEDSHAELVRFTLGRPGDVRTFGIIEDNGEDWLAFGRQRLLPVAALGLKGRHNAANALAALALGSSIDLPMSAMLSALREFTGLAHRHELVATVAGTHWINDSKATNTAAALASVSAIDGDVVLLVGGRGKGEDLGAFAAALPARVVQVIAYGELGREFTEACRTAGQVTQLVDGLAEAVLAASGAAPGMTVLLAPAAASQDAYRTYVERGEHFIALVKGLSA